MPSVVLIASPEHLPALRDRGDLGEVTAFTDAEALRALDLITRQRSPVVVLERLFAATSRGAALINRIKADPALAACEIRIIAHDSPSARRSPAPVDTAGVAAGAPAVAVTAPLDQRGTRRAPRFKVAGGVEMQVDGNPATVVDLSIVGAQILSPTILRPNQRIRVTLPNGPRSLRLNGVVAWASFEIPKGTVRYRAGVEFLDADPAALARVIEANKT
ncbi:MAG: hypothetical protein A3I61_04520 [Acidobacteria bacterium RIFCSPLOWO2_02_FULL_68_18]|nr:MAG: hypothetical protein A3I61_04520 [Acidobacteria bacterium RIFCSPLOWO2_02_FULL_68_18]OFW51777.1 MAG: hypothetical protein A3G77_10630 [Acidobacteria bacterium RIFCSPLOWO2_12_FULL_68_19]